jgi:hypothetical protein
MKYFIYNCTFFIIVLFFSYINTKNEQEAFTPKIRELYRPYVRNMRIISQDLYNKHSANASNLFRKIGIM